VIGWTVAFAKDREPEPVALTMSLPSAPDVEWSGLPTTPRRSMTASCGRYRGKEDESGTVDDGWFATTCRLTRGCLELEVSYVPAHYPEHLPEETTCTVGRYDVTIHLTPETPLYTDPAELRLALDGVGPLRLHVVGPTGSARATQTFALPAEVPWVEARALLKDAAGASWGLGACAVTPGSPALLEVSYDHTMHGEGTCTVPDGAGGTRTLRFRREDVEPAGESAR
jgi:hypothetical protein